MEKRILRINETNSTNSLLREMAAAGAPDGRVIIAARQTGGRGRAGRDFASPEGGLYLSMLRRGLSLDPGSVTARAALAVCSALEQVCGISPGIKWVNDLVLEGRKICGILCEALPTPEGMAYIIGVGVNVNTPAEAFPPQLRDIAGSIFSLTGQKSDIDALAGAIIGQLDSIFSAPQALCLERYRAKCVTAGREVLVLQGQKSFSAFAEAIDEDFSLIVRRRDGKCETVSFGEVSVRGLCGYL